jgi:hypothetical protein
MRVNAGGSFASRSQDARRVAALLRSQQAASDQIQTGERGGDFQAMQVLGQAPKASLANVLLAPSMMLMCFPAKMRNRIECHHNHMISLQISNLRCNQAL